jgi:predicted permease
MTAIALAAGLAPGFSLGGTGAVLATGLLIGTPAGLVYIVVRKYLPLPGAWKGAAFGALVFLALVLLPPPAARSAVASVGQLTLTLLLFGALFIAFGVAVEFLVRRLTGEEKQPQEPRPVSSIS